MTDLSAYNQFTIRDNGAGQIIGRAAEQEFAEMLIRERLPFEYLGPKCGPVDFKVGKVTIDVKIKERNVIAQPHYEAHVEWRLREKDCHVYVFASYCFDFEWMGYIAKKKFWEQAERVERGQLRDGFKESADAGKLAYSELLPLQELFSKLREHSE